ncbi:MAG: Unknown protein [uncultured Sulfurovum sp.]|uniref:Uncharacterized protein n=1 Tax=uncultured Sulfurovum sp. TaxID=269237 RepID=A0A6S6TTR8_9BACT|nr:MAG: Unknown protein [uncultured Sulfurovum sp.]
MKRIIFGMILGVLLVLTVFVGVEMNEKYERISSKEYVAPTEISVDIDGIKYHQ